jgi:Lipocalin-like domain
MINFAVELARRLKKQPGAGVFPITAIVSCLLLAVVAPIGVAKSLSASSEAELRAKLVGGWSLISRETHLENGELVVDSGLSATPMGVLLYDASGHVAAQLSRRDRTVAMIGAECASAAATKGTSDTAQTVLGYDAYFGTYTINAAKGIVTHHLQAAIWPGDIGKDIDRSFVLEGDRLTISFHTTTREGVRVTRTLVWNRMK